MAQMMARLGTVMAVMTLALVFTLSLAASQHSTEAPSDASAASEETRGVRSTTLSSAALFSMGS